MAWGYRILRAAARLVLAEQMRLEIVGIERLPKTGPLLLVSNHLGLTDQFVIAARLKHEVRILTKAELFEWPVLGGLARWADAVPIRRGEADRVALRTIRDTLRGGAWVLVFPEGTYAQSDEPLGMLPVKAGAAWLAWQSGAPIAPIAITGTESVWSPGRGWRIWHRPQVRVVFGEPYTPVWQESLTLKESLRIAADEMATRIAALLPDAYRGVYSAQSSGLATKSTGSASILPGSTPQV